MKRVTDKKVLETCPYIAGSEPTHTLFSQNSPKHLLVVAAPMCQLGVLPFSLSISACNTDIIITPQIYNNVRE